jgi:dihydroorotase
MVMPNLNPHIINAYQMKVYREEIQKEIKHNSEVLMTISLTGETTPQMIEQAAEEGCTAVKLYPAGVTTNSQCGITRDVLMSLLDTEEIDDNPFTHRFRERDPEIHMFWKNLEAIEDTGMMLCIHGELPGEEVLNRENAMMPLVGSILRQFGKIRVVMEHITTREAVNRINELDHIYPGRIAATITPHHTISCIP